MSNYPPGVTDNNFDELWDEERKQCQVCLADIGLDFDEDGLCAACYAYSQQENKEDDYLNPIWHFDNK